MPIAPLLLVLPTFAVTLDSATLPIRVEADDEALAAEGLALSEEIWAEQVEGMGFAIPLMKDDDGTVVDGFLLEISDMGDGVVATFGVGGENAATSWSDCPVRSQANSVYMDDPAIFSMSVAHLLNHASLHAVDCLEPQMPAFDFFTVAIEVQTGRGAYWEWYLEAFQSMPYESVDHAFMDASTAAFQFGSALFPLMLDQVWGDGDGAFLAEAWEGTAQDGHITRGFGEMAEGDVENEPDFLDALAGALAARGATFDEAFATFTEYRWFVGANDDGAHLVGADAWAGGEPFVDTEIAWADLPVDGIAAAEPLAEYGSSFVVIHLEDVPGEELHLVLDGAEGVGWAATALCLAEGAPAVPYPLPFDGTHGEGAVPLDAGCAQVVLAISALSDGSHDPEDQDWDRDYPWTLSAEARTPPAEEDPDAEGGGCGCASGGSQAGFGWIAFGLGLLARRRRWAAAR